MKNKGFIKTISHKRHYVKWVGSVLYYQEIENVNYF
jgi:hypothetical protein